MQSTKTRAGRVRTRLGELRVEVDGEPGEQRAVVLWPSMFLDRHTFDRLLPLLPGRHPVTVAWPDRPGAASRSPPAPSSPSVRT